MDKVTIDTYNRTAQAYDVETTSFWDLFPRTIIDKFASIAHGRVLDVGSGPGRDGLILQEKGLKVVCLDASEAMVALSTSRGLQSIVGDFCALPFPNESFGGVWAYTALLHIPKNEVRIALSEIARVLVKGGVFGLGLIEGDDEQYRESSGIHLPRWFSYYRQEEIENLLQTHEFTITYFEQFKPASKNYLNFVARK
ncbi:class I SAM-dependent methyltransferase [Candidatus Kaiserbacteria bacterium]|nr:class I SAM-dependent methyltransferase [Candidatus Kaiserbacteria bacterium]